MTVDCKYIDFALEDNRIRLIGEGPTAQLVNCKDAFTNSLLDIETGDATVSVVCVVPQQAHCQAFKRNYGRSPNRDRDCPNPSSSPQLMFKECCKRARAAKN